MKRMRVQRYKQYHAVFNQKCKHWDNAKRQLFKEWRLTSPGVIRALKYNPDTDKFSAKTMYVVEEKVPDPENKRRMITRDVERTTHIQCEYDILKDQFDEKVLAAVVAAGLQKGDDEEDPGFYKIDPSLVKEEGMNRFHTYQVTKVRYVPGHNKYRETMNPGIHKQYEEQFKLHKEFVGSCWQGVVADTGERISLPEDWVEECFGKRFMQELKERGNTQFVPIPPGAVRESNLKNNKRLQLLDAPTMQYHQGNRICARTIHSL